FPVAIECGLVNCRCAVKVDVVDLKNLGLQENLEVLELAIAADHLQRSYGGGVFPVCVRVVLDKSFQQWFRHLAPSEQDMEGWEHPAIFGVNSVNVRSGGQQEIKYFRVLPS